MPPSTWSTVRPSGVDSITLLTLGYHLQTLCLSAKFCDKLRPFSYNVLKRLWTAPSRGPLGLRSCIEHKGSIKLDRHDERAQSTYDSHYEDGTTYCLKVDATVKTLTCLGHLSDGPPFHPLVGLLVQ